MVGDKVSLAGALYAYADLRQVTYTQSYLQLLLRPQGEEPRKIKIFFPSNAARNIHDLLLELQGRYTKTETPTATTTHQSRGKTRRSLGVVCDQIVGVAKEVGKSIRTPSKRTRSLSTDPKIGGKRRKLSLGGTLNRSESTKRQQEKENTSPVPVAPPTSAKMAGKEPRIRTQSGTIRTVATSTTQRRRPLPEKPVHLTSGGSNSGSEETSRHGRVRMGTRMVGENNRTNFEGERRIHQFRLKLKELSGGWNYTSTGNGLMVAGCTATGYEAQLQIGDRILAVNGVSMEHVTIQTFWRLITKFGDEVDVIVSRLLK